MEEETEKLDQSGAGWRFRIGVVVFIMGFLSPLLIPWVLASGLSGKWKAILSGGLSFGLPEVFTLLAIAIMGKEGFNILKERLFGLMRRYGPPDQVSRSRYRAGIIMFLLPLLFGWVTPYVSTHMPGYEVHRLVIGIVGDVLLISSLFVLGGEFWDKVRALFVYDAKARFGP
jgi:hypothetical protein